MIGKERRINKQIEKKKKTMSEKVILIPQVIFTKSLNLENHHGILIFPWIKVSVNYVNLSNMK